MYEAVLSWIERHPQTFVMLVAIAVPVLGSVASFLDGWAAKRWPIAVALARALLPDLKRAGAILVSGALESRKLPVPPEVRQLTVERVEKAIEESASKRPPPPPIVTMMLGALLGAFVLLATGCTRAEQIQAANAQRGTGHATAHVLGADAPEKRSLGALCDYEALEGKPDEYERSIDLDNRGCKAALAAQTAFSLAHKAQVKAIDDAQAGKCTIGAPPATTPACRLVEIAGATYNAGLALARAVAEVRAAVKGAGK
jgi:hypothetical protein